ncbi:MULTISPECIES: hypothetical protein [Edwardsiella]|uniref:Uncharacterized protein n=2 Tax=Edwardsiella anguillarum TaxID=1821960 RepID=A0ABY8SII5_9GAMM|nr:MULTISPECIES: hypothetical protein [Edwardsiella]AKR77042.1 hypothetical protein AAZ33_04225 [Edwardsiella sp. LADL05-105]KAB0587217.1 hypothetical protein F7P84_17835 [Edwardsiella anguillarum]WHP84687.1 hypothetical protein MQ095_04320 [Edwardsiella anguillarum]WHP88471.1 hypothetical protein MQ088_04325 [Edwardsiella anguillarum]WHP92272.1 hypothetical protein MQ091_04325 [Edwardsiella anguillarum]
MRKIMLYVAMVWSVLAAMPCWSTTLKVETLSTGMSAGEHSNYWDKWLDHWIVIAPEGCVISNIKEAKYFDDNLLYKYWADMAIVEGEGTREVTLWIKEQREQGYADTSRWKGEVYVKCLGPSRRVQVKSIGYYRGSEKMWAGGLDFDIDVTGGQSVTAEVNDLNFPISNYGCTAYQTIGRASSDIASLTGTIVKKPSESSIQLELASKSGELRARICNTGVGAGRYSWMVTATLAVK